MRKILSYCLLFGFCSSGLGQTLTFHTKIGDLITNSDDSKGVVFWINSERTKGYMINIIDEGNSLCRPYGVWTSVPGLPHLSYFDALNDMNGYTNTLMMQAHYGCDTVIYGACGVDVANGWFIPSMGIWNLFHAMYPFIRQKLIDYGGTDLVSYPSVAPGQATGYMTSTQADATFAYYAGMNGGVVTQGKNLCATVRTVREFSMPLPVPYDTTLTYLWNTGHDTTSFVAHPTTDSLFTVTATSSVGCVSTASKQIFVSTNEERILYDTICVGYAYRQNGFDLPPDSNTLAGDFTYHNTLHNGDCEIDLTLHLTKKPSEETIIIDSFCDGKSYIHNGVIYESAGDYVQFFTSSQGCDSVLHLSLSLKQGVATNLSAEIACGQYVWNNQIYQQSGIYSQTLVAANGCDSVVNKTITILGNTLGWLELDSCHQITYNHHVFFRDTTFVHTLVNASGCDSLLTVNLKIHHPGDDDPGDDDPIDYDTEIVLYWESVLAVPNRKNLDELRYAVYYWYRDDVLLPQSNRDWIEVGMPVPAGKYNVSIHYGGSEILYLERVFDEASASLSAYPNPLNVAEELTVRAHGNGIRRVEIFDVYGVLQLVPIRIGATDADKGAHVDAPLRVAFKTSGIYILRIHLDDHTIETLKIVVK